MLREKPDEREDFRLEDHPRFGTYISFFHPHTGTRCATVLAKLHELRGQPDDGNALAWWFVGEDELKAAPKIPITGVDADTLPELLIVLPTDCLALVVTKTRTAVEDGTASRSLRTDFLADFAIH